MAEQTTSIGQLKEALPTLAACLAEEMVRALSTLEELAMTLDMTSLSVSTKRASIDGSAPMKLTLMIEPGNEMEPT
jgi:hypothetical protein